MDPTHVEPRIEGWGADLDPARRPAYPKEKVPPEGTGAHWDRPEPQQSEVEILQSIEHTDMPRVFGTPCPPRGLSGAMRRQAYRYAESNVSRWMILLLADRVDVVEGVLEDLRRGHVPNLFAEMGFRADLKHNKMRIVRLALASVAAGGLITAGLATRRGKSRQKRARRDALRARRAG